MPDEDVDDPIEMAIELLAGVAKDKTETPKRRERASAVLAHALSLQAEDDPKQPADELTPCGFGGLEVTDDRVSDAAEEC